MKSKKSKARCDARLIVLVSDDQKQNMQKMADDAGLSLSSWARERLVQATD